MATFEDDSSAEIPLSLVFEDRANYLYVQVSGDWEFRALLQAVDSSSAEMEARGCERAMIDVRSLGSPPLLIDHYDAVKKLAERFSGSRVALVAREAQLRDFCVDVARDRGLEIILATELSDATHRLLRE